MKELFLGAAVLGGFAALSLWNYRRFVPKPVPFSSPRYKVQAQKIHIMSGGHRLYGELLVPQGIGGPLPTVICSHGYNGSYHYFRDSVGMCMAMSGFVVCCFDFYGGSAHGKSGGTMKDMSIFSQRDDLNAVIAHVKELPFVDTANLFLWRESQGGFVTAVTAAEHRSDIKALVLFYPAFCAAEDMRKRFPSRDAIPEKPRIMGKEVSRAYCDELYDYDAYGEIGKFTGPVLIVHGDADRTVDIAYGRKAAQVYEDARFEALPGEDHGFSGKGKLKAAKLVYNFLQEQLS